VSAQPGLAGGMVLGNRLGESGRGRKCVATQWFRYGYGHAGYPFLMEYGDSDVLVDDELLTAITLDVQQR